jgi:hypothetical protein
MKKITRDDITVGMMVILNNGDGSVGHGSTCKITKIDGEKKTVKLKAKWMAGKSYWFYFDQIKFGGIGLSEAEQVDIAKDALPDAPSSHKSEFFAAYSRVNTPTEFTILVLTGKDIEEENPIIYNGFEVLILPAKYEHDERRYLKNAKISPNTRETGRIIYV